jgi:hypothetical protein
MNVVGWDIGGVHLKAARAERGCIVDALQLAAPLRAGLDPLVQAFAMAKARIGPAQRHVVTMTAELADIFASRQDGVARIAALAARELGDTAMLYAGRRFPSRSIAPPGTSSTRVRQLACALRWSRAGIGRRFIDRWPIRPTSYRYDGAIAARLHRRGNRLAAGEPFTPARCAASSWRPPDAPLRA